METLKLLRERCRTHIMIIGHLVANKDEISEEAFNDQLNDIKQNIIPNSKIHDIFEFKPYVYALKLEDDCYYIGFSVHLTERLTSHFNGMGSQWTKLHKPVSVDKIIPGDTEVENKLTIEYMKIYGWEKVRGGKWCAIKLTQPLILKKLQIEEQESD
jgi:predicted GIY-YIG superfamily endonuclease